MRCVDSVICALQITIYNDDYDGVPNYSFIYFISKFTAEKTYAQSTAET